MNEDRDPIQDLVEYMARNLVENEDGVVVTDDFDGHRHIFHLDVGEGDMGKVIGRGGRVAEAMRALIKVAAAKQDTRAVLDIGD
ncbi:MAG TPA: KH domain-containing protein [Dehalococcoidia bacterium]|jgi:hypothetical protein